MNNKKIFRILQLIIIVLIIINGINIYNKFYKIEDKEELSASLFAMQIRDEENESYKIYSSNKFPIGYDLEQIKCTDKDKNLIDDRNLPEFNYDSASGTLKGNIDKGIYCILSFGKHKDMSFTFELNGTGEYNGEKYTNKKNIEAVFNWNYDGVDSYCISTNLNGNDCEWKSLKPESGGNLKATIAYNLSSDENTKQVFYGFLKAKNKVSNVQVASITYDNVMPSCNFNYSKSSKNLGLSFTDKTGVIFEDGSSYKNPNNQNKNLGSISAKIYKYVIKDFAGNSQNCELEVKNKETVTTHVGGDECTLYIFESYGGTACTHAGGELITSIPGGCTTQQNVPTSYCAPGDRYTQCSCPYDTSALACPSGTKEITGTNYCSSSNITIN